MNNDKSAASGSLSPKLQWHSAPHQPAPPSPGTNRCQQQHLFPAAQFLSELEPIWLERALGAACLAGCLAGAKDSHKSVADGDDRSTVQTQESWVMWPELGQSRGAEGERMGALRWGPPCIRCGPETREVRTLRSIGYVYGAHKRSSDVPAGAAVYINFGVGAGLRTTWEQTVRPEN